MGRSVWLQLVSQWAGLQAPPMGARGRTIVCFGRIGIPYKCPVSAGRDSFDNTPVTVSLHFAAPGCRLADFIAEGLVLCVLRGSADSLQFAVCRALRIVLRHWSDIVMATGGKGPADGQSGINFGVELEVPWNTPEAYVHLDSHGVYDLATVPDVLGLHARWPGAAVVRVLLGPLLSSGSAHSRPGFPWRHDFGHGGLSRAGCVCRRPIFASAAVCHGCSRNSNIADSIKKTPPRHSGSCLFVLRKMDKVGHESSCGDLSLGACSAVALPGFVVYCVEGDATGLYGSLTKGTCGAGGGENREYGKWFLPWTVRREAWTDALKPCNSGISTDVLLFSELGHALVHHYRVF